MKNKLNDTIFLTILSVFVLGQTMFAQQGGLDTTWGTNNTGIYQDAFPTLPLPNPNVGDEGRQFGASEILADGKIIAAGSAGINTGTGSYVFDFLVRRLNADGSVDPTFGANGEARTTFYRWGPGLNERSVNPTYTMKIQPDGKIILASSCSVGGTTVPNGTALGTDLCLVRYNANGSLDTSFGGNTVFSYGGNQNFPGNNNTMDPGKVFTVTGTDTVNGATNGFSGIPVKIQIAPDGRIFVFGYNSSDRTPALGSRNKSFVAIYSTNGTLQNIVSLFDTTGNPTNGYGTTRVYDGGLLSNGDFIAVGYQTTLVSANPQTFSPARWKIFTGSSGGGFLESNVNSFGEARSITMVRSNKILVGGNISGFGNPMLVRYNGDLTVDTTFGSNGRIVYDGTGNNTGIGNSISSLKTQPDGKIIGTTTSNGDIVRFNANGSLDRSFARLREDVADSLSLRGLLPSRRYNTPFPVVGSDTGISYGGISFRPNGKLVVAGFAGSAFGSFPYRATVIQLKTSFRNGGTFSDFNNDGKAEISVFRDGNWYLLDSFSNNFSGVNFGFGTDKPVPADYDGDGKTDIAVFRDGFWYYLRSSDGQFRGVQWGQAGDLPRPGDFNGDGQADIAVFRPSNGTWYILYSNPIQPGNITFTATAFGQSGDVPLLADFDGDGKSDIAVYRGGFWYYLRSSDGQFRGLQFGASTDIPVAGDYDGDGKADVAVFRPSNGNWYYLKSSDGSFYGAAFGQNGDKPVPGDYDNDGKNDLAVFRGGNWYVLQSSNNQFTGVLFGFGTDIPIPSVYLP